MFTISFRPTGSDNWIPVALSENFQNQDDATTTVVGMRSRSAEAKLFKNGVMIAHLHTDETTMDDLWNS